MQARGSIKGLVSLRALCIWCSMRKCKAGEVLYAVLVYDPTREIRCSHIGEIRNTTRWGIIIQYIYWIPPRGSMICLEVRSNTANVA